MVDAELGVGLVYPYDQRFQRLDLWLADQTGGLPVGDQLSILRQIAEIVGYAHRNRVVHRGLTPQSVMIRRQADGLLRVQVGDWQSAGAVASPAQTSLSSGVTGLLGLAEPDLLATGGDSGSRLVAADADKRLAEAFEAPEGVWNRDADRIRLDIFALGAIAYYVLAGRPAATDRASLRERVHREDGLDLAVDLPQVAPIVRALVLDATRSAVSERLPDARSFVARLADAEPVLTTPADDEGNDPLDAVQGMVLDGRFRLERRLGRGSTAVGLLVTDLAVGDKGPDAVRVLKVAVDDSAATRLEAEAEVLRGLTDHRMVRLIEGPIMVGDRCALVLEPAGDETLAEVLRSRERLSLDLLERWGSDLLEALVALDRAGVDHRDIKPSNLGVREGRSDRVKHLVLFDFSLARAGATAVTAGTPPYLDPFLDDPGRGRYDSAAERYSAAVVLFEMATGASPRYGDGESHPASVREEAAVEPGMFDPVVADRLTAFFRQALARSTASRYDTAADMLAAWQAVFAPVPRTVPEDANDLAEQAQPTTELSAAGLSARALSALEQFGVRTVADLVAVDAVRLNRMSGVADVTRREVKSRAAEWRRKFSQVVTGRGAAALSDRPTTLPDPAAAAELLVEHAGGRRALARRQIARLLLGLEPGLDAFASQSELSTVLGVTAARATQQVGGLQDAWAGDDACRALLDALCEIARQALADFGGVATVEELANAALAAMPPVASMPPSEASRVAAGLVRVALDRNQALGRAGYEGITLTPRRRAGRIILLAADAGLLDPAEALGRAADQLVTQAAAAGEPLVPADRAAPRLQDTWRSALGQTANELAPGRDRLLRLAAATAREAVLSGSLELHHRDLAAPTALALALNGAGSTQELTPQEMRDRLRARFPALPPLPDRPRLDQLVTEAGLDLHYDEATRAYRSATRVADTTGLSSRPQTAIPAPQPELVNGGHVGHRLAESVSARSFLALGVDARKMDRATRALTAMFGAALLDITELLIEAMRAQAAEVGLPWELVRAADAAPAGSREAEGLDVLVRRSLPAVESAIDKDAAGAPDGGRPVLLTEVAPLARYGQLGILAPRADLTLPRRQAVWVVVPQLPGNQGAVIDGRPLPLAAPGQYFRLAPQWIDAQVRVPVTGGSS